MIKKALLLLALLTFALSVTTEELQECTSQLEVLDLHEECNVDELSDESSLSNDEDSPCVQMANLFPESDTEEWSDDFGEIWHECQNQTYSILKEICSDKYLDYFAANKECGGDFGVPLATGDDDSENSSLLKVTLALAVLVALIF